MTVQKPLPQAVKNVYDYNLGVNKCIELVNSWISPLSNSVYDQLLKDMSSKIKELKL